jgi:hypothetical protein
MVGFTGTPDSDSNDVAPTYDSVTIYISKIIWTYMLPMSIIIGISLNILIICVLRVSLVGKSSTRLLLTGLAMADTAVLLTNPLRQGIIRCFATDVRHLTHASCPVHYFCSYFLEHFSHWNVLLLTVERWISVTYPLRARVICTMKWTLVALSMTSILLFTLNAHLLFEYRLGKVISEDSIHFQCTYVSKSYSTFMVKVYTHLEIVLSFGIPFPGIVLFNSSILWQLFKTGMKRRKLQNLGTSSDCDAARLSSMTHMLVAVSVAFLVLLTPKAVWLLVYRSLTRPVDKFYWFYLASPISYVLYSLNHGTNFILYCISGRQFREAFYQMCR